MIVKVGIAFLIVKMVWSKKIGGIYHIIASFVLGLNCLHHQCMLTVTEASFHSFI